MNQSIICKLAKTLNNRKNADPKHSYVAQLLTNGTDTILRKINEEAFEAIIAAKANDNENLVDEICDLLFHTLVLMTDKNITWQQIENKLDSRFGISGIQEKQNRNKNV